MYIVYDSLQINITTALYYIVLLYSPVDYNLIF